MMLIDAPILINHLALQNRLVMPPMATAKGGEKDEVSSQAIAYYAERARLSGVGLIITEHMYVDRQGKAHEGQISIANDEGIDSLKQLTDAIHREDVKVFAQISHAGAATSIAVTETSLVGPSAPSQKGQAMELPEELKKDLPEELTKDQIQRIVSLFADAAVRAEKAGFDGVEVHSAHGYLLNQFYSPLSNHRTDDYGIDTMENRIRIHLEIIREIRKRLGFDFPIAVRMGGSDYVEGGTSVEDTVKACRLLEENSVDLLDITGGMTGFVRPGHREAGYFREISTQVKRSVKIPVLLTGGVKTAREAEDLIEEECADLIGFGRVLLNNPEAINLSR